MSVSFGPEHRELLDRVGTELYNRALDQGFLLLDDSRFAEGTEQRAAIDALLAVGLFRLDAKTGRLHPENPALAQSQTVVPLAQRGNDLIVESATWSDSLRIFSQAYRASPMASLSGITELRDLSKINTFLTSIVNDARSEVLTAQPYGKRPASQLALAEDRDMKALSRGVRIRTLYQHSARHGPTTRGYVAEMVKRGGEVRTLDEFFRRTIVVDRRVAIIPANDDNSAAVAIQDPSIVAYLVDIFERAWERGMPFTLKGEAVERNIAADVRSMTIRLLGEGHSDASSAKRLGVSTRTYAGYIATLKDEYAVQTRFQLGWAMARKDDDQGDEAERPEERFDPWDEVG